MEILEISSPQNPRVKEVVRLREGKHRRKTGRFVIEGRRELERAMAAGRQFTEVFVCGDFLGDAISNDLVTAIAAHADAAYQVPKEVFLKMSHREGPDGFLAVAHIWETRFSEISFAGTPFVVVVESLEKPGNLGTIMRTADAAGADLLVIADPVTDAFNPNAIRSSQGAFFSLPFVVATSAETLAWLESAGITPIALTPDADDLLWDCALDRAVAIILGSEAFGLSRTWLGLDTRTRKAKLPMAGISDSLNVSACAAVSLFEVVRQRHARR